jgi:hypothetical protein
MSAREHRGVTAKPVEQTCVCAKPTQRQQKDRRQYPHSYEMPSRRVNHIPNNIPQCSPPDVPLVISTSALKFKHPDVHITLDLSRVCCLKPTALQTAGCWPSPSHIDEGRDACKYANTDHSDGPEQLECPLKQPVLVFDPAKHRNPPCGSHAFDSTGATHCCKFSRYSKRFQAYATCSPSCSVARVLGPHHRQSPCAQPPACTM